MLSKNITIKHKLSLHNKQNNANKFDMHIQINSNHVIAEQTISQLEKNINSLIGTYLYEYEIERPK